MTTDLHAAVAERRSSRYMIPAEATRHVLDATYPGHHRLRRLDAEHILDQLARDVLDVTLAAGHGPTPGALASAEQRAAHIAAHAATILATCAVLEGRWPNQRSQDRADGYADIARNELVAAEEYVRLALDTTTN